MVFMQKYRNLVGMFVASANLLFAVVLLSTVWKYQSKWDKSDAEIQKYFQANNTEIIKVQLEYDEKLLDILHYWYLPPTAILMVTSTYVIWVYRKRPKD